MRRCQSGCGKVDLLSEGGRMQKCITCILIMLVAFLTFSACGNPENQDMQELEVPQAYRGAGGRYGTGQEECRSW